MISDALIPGPGRDYDVALALDAVEEKPNLPRVLLIGDLISVGYTLPVRERLNGVANVQRIPENGQHTCYGLQKLDEWLGNQKWDVIHFNFGLHDVKIMDDAHQVPIEEYEANLRAIVKKLQGTGAVLIWATTTPIPSGPLNPPRRFGDEVIYNQAATRVMQEDNILINDLNALALAHQSDIQRHDDVHFNARGYEILGEQVAATIQKVLQR